MTFKEVVLYYQFQEVFVVLKLNPVSADRISNLLDLLVVLIQVLLHALSLLHIGLRRFIQNPNLLLMLRHLLVHYYLLLSELHDLRNRGRTLRNLVLIIIVTHNVIYLFNLLHEEHHLGFSLPDL